MVRLVKPVSKKPPVSAPVVALAAAVPITNEPVPLFDNVVEAMVPKLAVVMVSVFVPLTFNTFKLASARVPMVTPAVAAFVLF